MKYEDAEKAVSIMDKIRKYENILTYISPCNDLRIKDSVCYQFRDFEIDDELKSDLREFFQKKLEDTMRELESL